MALVMVKRLAASVTDAEAPFLRDPEHEQRDLRPWSALSARGLLENGPDGPRRTWLGDLVLAEYGREHG